MYLPSLVHWHFLACFQYSSYLKLFLALQFCYVSEPQYCSYCFLPFVPLTNPCSSFKGPCLSLTPPTRVLYAMTLPWLLMSVGIELVTPPVYLLSTYPSIKTWNIVDAHIFIQSIRKHCSFTSHWVLQWRGTLKILYSSSIFSRECNSSQCPILMLLGFPVLVQSKLCCLC